VCRQTYANWELCLSDGSHNDKRLERFVKSYTEKDDRIRYIALKDGPLGISENTNQALGIATGEFVVLGDHDDVFAENMLYECVTAINSDKNIDVMYSDEDKVDMKGTVFADPNFKPDFNIDLLRSNNYICHVFVVRRAIAERIGGFRKEFDGAQDYDFILRCVEQTENIYHIPKVLYHWRSHLGSTADMPEAKMYAFEAGKRAIEEHYRRMSLQAAVDYGDDLGFYKTRYEIKGNPLVSIIIPNKDHIDDLKKCMDSIDMKSDYRNFEYVIVENNSEKSETFEFYKKIEQRENVKVVYWKDGFNFSAINNYGARYAEGEYLLLLNNDTEIINEDCLSQMLGYCQRDDVGIVGARLYYPDESVQHAGVIVGMGGIAGHAFVGLNESDGLYQSRTKVACDYSAVTAACMMVKKSIYEQVGGLEEKYRVAFNDIDFCMKVRETGKLVVYNANAKLYHYESKSRGMEDTPEKQERFQGEIQMFQERWPEILIKGDPYYNKNLTLDKSDFSLRE
jgi:GT2 family glycosyltransferase